MELNDSWIDKSNAEQTDMLKQLESQEILRLADFKPTDPIVTLDVQYVGEKAYVGFDVVNFLGEENLSFISQEICEVPYLPGYFSFREGPVLVNAIKKLKEKRTIDPSLLLIDGHGTAHPRKMGVAVWVGIKTGIPSMGVAKDPLLKQEFDLGEAKGSYSPVHLKGETVGMALRTQDGIKPLYISPGYRLSLDASKELAIRFAGKYRNLEPIRRADQAARAFANGAPLKNSILL